MNLGTTAPLTTTEAKKPGLFNNLFGGKKADDKKDVDAKPANEPSAAELEKMLQGLTGGKDKASAPTPKREDPAVNKIHAPQLSPEQQQQMAMQQAAYMQQLAAQQPKTPFTKLTQQFGTDSKLEFIESFEANPNIIKAETIQTKFEENTLVVNADDDEKNGESKTKQIAYMPLPDEQDFQIQFPAGSQIGIQEADIKGKIPGLEKTGVLKDIESEEIIQFEISVPKPKANPAAPTEFKKHILPLPKKLLNRYHFSLIGKKGPTAEAIFRAAMAEAKANGKEVSNALANRVNENGKFDSEKVREEIIVAETETKKKLEKDINPVLLNDQTNPELKKVSPVFLHKIDRSKSEDKKQEKAFLDRIEKNGEWTDSTIKFIKDKGYGLIGVKDNQLAEMYPTYAVKKEFTVDINGSHYTIMPGEDVLPKKLVDILAKADGKEIKVNSKEGNFSVDNNFTPTKTILIRDLIAEDEGKVGFGNVGKSITVLREQALLIVPVCNEGKTIKTVGKKFRAIHLPSDMKLKEDESEQITEEEKKEYLELLKRTAESLPGMAGVKGEPLNRSGPSETKVEGEESSEPKTGSGSWNPMSWFKSDKKAA